MLLNNANRNHSIRNNSASQCRRLLAAAALAAIAGVGLLPAAASAQPSPAVAGGPVVVDYAVLDALGIDRVPVDAAIAALVR
jgi:hypothetical protein